jgi:moderate conductance mechanosensitive channel
MLQMQISKEVWIPWVQKGVSVVIILAGAWLLTRIARRLLRRLRTYTVRVMDRRGSASTIELENRAATIIAVLGKLASTVIWIVALVMALSQLDFHIEPLLAGLGVAGIAVGLGAQTLIKDWLGGLFLLLEDQIRIGDAVVINAVSGTVEEINLRMTIVRAENGAVHIIPNGSITALANLTREYSYYIFETTLAHRADIDRAFTILDSVGAELADDDELKALILAPIEVMGVERLADSGAVIKARIKTLPSKQAAVGRELNRRVKARLDAAGISFPEPRLPRA